MAKLRQYRWRHSVDNGASHFVRTKCFLFIWLVVLADCVHAQTNSTLMAPGYIIESSQVLPSRITENLEEMQNFLREFNIEAAEMCNRVANIEWKYATNASDYNRRRMKEQKAAAEKFECVSWRRAATFADRQISESNVRRQIQRIFKQGKCGLSDDKYAELSGLIQLMIDNYKKVRVCPYQSGRYGADGTDATHRDTNGDTNGPHCDLSIDKELSRTMETSRSEMELRYIWSEWHRKAGAPNRNNFMRYVDLANQAAAVHGFADAGEQMRAIYEDPEIYFTLQDLWAQIQPLYRQLFTFVRKGLIRQYGVKAVRPDGPIPAHLFGNMYAQNWKHIVDVAKSRYSETPNVTQELIRQGYTPHRMFQKAEEFFTSLGMPSMSPEFWRNSVLQQPRSDTSRCTSSAWDFCNNHDFRVKQCTDITLEDFIQTHYKVSNVQYYMSYANQPFVYRDGPNPAFHEAIAHAIGLSVGGPVHLQRIGLLNTPIQTANGNTVINIEYLLAMAMEKLPYLAFSLAIEKWRWNVFEKGPVGLNARWWELRLRYQGVVPPIARSSDDFDAGAKYHIISDQDYIKYFVGTILQFQIYAELCETVNHVGPLHTCDFYRSREAGRILSEVMQHGASLSPNQLLKILTRGKTSRISAEPLLTFFNPLKAWLEQQNRNDIIGWNSNMDDVLLFKPLTGSTQRLAACTILTISAFAVVVHLNVSF